MKLTLFISLRYLFSKKSHNAINIISVICAIGICLATAALVIVLSVYNGFQDLIQSLFSPLDPDLRITLSEGKVFDNDIPEIKKLKELDFIEIASEILEDNALARCEDKQAPVTLKGVDSDYGDLARTSEIIRSGDFILRQDENDFAVIGAALSAKLEVGCNFVKHLSIYTPKHNAKISMSAPEKSFNSKDLYVTGIYALMQEETDSKFVFVPIDLAREMFDYNSKKCSAIEIKLNNRKTAEKAKTEIQNLLGEKFKVKNREEQHEDFFKMLKIEKWITYLILTFILMIAVFNIIGSLTMLILEKENDIKTLHSLGLSLSKIRRIFLAEGWLISILGSISGILIGLILCFMQKWLGIIKLNNDDSGMFIVNEYPVSIQFSDIIIIAATVLLAGLAIAWYPTRRIGRTTLQ